MEDLSTKKYCWRYKEDDVFPQKCLILKETKVWVYVCYLNTDGTRADVTSNLVKGKHAFFTYQEALDAFTNQTIKAVSEHKNTIYRLNKNLDDFMQMERA